MALQVSDLVSAMESIAPTSCAEPWDNVGLLIGRDEDELRGPALLTIDLTEPVLEEANRVGAGAVVAYHPPIFSSLKRLTGASGRQRVVLEAIRSGVAVYSPHTALDAVAGGVTDWLADGLLGGDVGGGADRRPLAPWSEQSSSEQMKIVTFVPESSADDVRSGLAASGAGLIGAYRQCSFNVRGWGTFFGDEGTNPAVGEAGRLERAEEVRLEMVCSRKALPLALAMLNQLHPYEEPAVDVYALEGKPHRTVGSGRRLVLDQPTGLEELAGRLKSHAGARVVKVAPAGRSAVDKVGVVPGSGASLADAARADGCELFVTGEMKHHEVVAQVEAGMAVMLLGHTTSERGYLPTLASRLGEALPGLETRVSEEDRTPFLYC